MGAPLLALPKFIDSGSFPFANGARRLWKWILKAECQNKVSLLRQMSQAVSSPASLQVCLCAHFLFADSSFT